MARAGMEIVEWGLTEAPTEHRKDAWAETVNKVYGRWHLDRIDNPDFSAEMKTWSFGDFNLTECICDPCSAHRTRKDSVLDDTEVLAIQLVLDGREHMTFEGQRFELNPGDIFIWDNTKGMRFDVQERLHKISAILPLKRLRDWLPDTWHRIPRLLDGSSAQSTLLKSYITSVRAAAAQSHKARGDALSEATVALLVSMWSEDEKSANAHVMGRQLSQIKAYINDNLDDCELTLEGTAANNNISIRQLHQLFSATNQTATEYVITQRLDRCLRDILNPMMAARTVTDIAFSWGFKDSSHFSKRFKAQYGCSPAQMRKQSAVSARC